MRTFLSLTLTAALLVLSSSSPASAQIFAVKVCNQTAVTITFAIGYDSGADITTEGWWNIRADTCANVSTTWEIKGSRYYYAYDSQNRQWDGTARTLCINLKNRFKFNNADDTSQCTGYRGFRPFTVSQLNLAPA